uniref:Uncharacterized protein KIAA1797 n=1 Tax=Anthurium amnicola TaxID=1678845 RepID=A0A1D1Z387_9ARAE
MDTSPYGALLEKTRLPQPALQRYAVTAVFQKLRSAPPHAGVDSGTGRDAVSFCLSSRSPAVVDQAVRELCLLVTAGGVKLEFALVELQSALEGCGSLFVALFVKGIGFLCRFGFRRDLSWGCSHVQSPELHPFVKVLSSRHEVQEELTRQVLLFIVHNRLVGMEAVSEFIRPFLVFSILMIPSSAHASMFAKDLVSNLASLSCSLPTEAIAIIRLLTGCLEYFPISNEVGFKCLMNSAEYLVDALVVVLQQMVKSGMPNSGAQICGVELLETILSICTDLHKPFRGSTSIVELSMRLLVAERQLALPYLPEFSSVMLSLSVILCQVEFEHEQLSILKLLIFLTEWKTQELDTNDRGAAFDVHQELLQIFPVINVLSSSSKPVTDAVTDLLSIFKAHTVYLLASPRKDQSSKAAFQTRSKLGSILWKLLHHLLAKEHDSLSGSCFLEFSFKDDSGGRHNKPTQWLSWLGDYASSTIQRSKLMPASHSRESASTGMPLLLSAVASTFIVHPKLGTSAIDSLASLATMDPKVSMTLLLAILFYHKVFCSDGYSSSKTLLKLLEVLPMLALSSAMVPLILQILVPMLQKDVKPMLYAIAVRLLCRTWIVTDRVFESLQGVLDPNSFSVFANQREICISIAASIRDVCRHNPDRGVDLILSVSSCIESNDSSVQTLGFEAIAYLCEADVVDFYTAWNVIEVHMLDYSVDPVVACGLCSLLRWGAMDAKAYSESSENVIRILWDVGKSDNSLSGYLWVKARVSAFKSLIYYEIEDVHKAIPDFVKRSLELVTSESNPEVLEALEGFVVRIINFEHINRRRLLRDRKVLVHKVEKLLDVFPQAMFSSAGKQKGNIKELPGASLLSVIFTPKDVQNQQVFKDLSKLHGIHEAMLLEVAESLQISRNIFIALLALQSWKAFMNRWVKAVTDAKASPSGSDESSKEACAILKILQRLAENSIPRVAANIALAIGALCMVLPPSAHTAASTASNFLLQWLFQYEHEHRQWSAAISLGLVTNCLHMTDRAQKHDIINGLLKVIHNSVSYLVKGACGVGLGFVCEHMLTQTHDDSIPDARLAEAKLLGKIIQSLSLMISRVCPSSSESLMCLHENFPLDGNDAQADEGNDLLRYSSDELDDSWGIAGLILGLGNTVSALYRIGAYDAVLRIQNILLSYIPLSDSSPQSSHYEMYEIPLSIGSCLALPSVVAFCQRSELTDIDLPGLLNGYSSLISKLLAIKNSANAYQNLLMASSIGAGSLLSFILNEGVCSVKFDDVKCLLEIIRSTYTHPPPVQLGGMFGIINAFGAGAGTLTHVYLRPSLRIDDAQKDLLYIRSPVLANPALESLSTSLIQEMFVIAKESKDMQTRRYAAWAISFLRYWLWSQDSQSVDYQHRKPSGSKQESNISENSLVWGLYSWLNGSEMGTFPSVNTVASVLRCLSQAPRVPTSSDWGAIINRCMKYGTQLSSKSKMMGQEPKTLREECVHFALTHANCNNSLVLFLDELADGSRFTTLELNLQCSLLCWLPDITRVFSASRMEKLYGDLVGYFSSSKSSYVFCDADRKCLLRISFWKGLHECLVKSSDKLVCVSEVEKCIELLFSLLPVFISTDGSVEKEAHFQELTEAVNCLSEVPQIWLTSLLQVPKMELLNGGNHAVEVAKKIIVTARLIMKGCFLVSELGKLKACILNSSSEGVWSVLKEVVRALCGADGTMKRQWLLDAVEISCIARYPSTALQLVGMLSSQYCDYMPLLILNSRAVLSDLPVTLPSLLSDSSWSIIAEPLAAKLWASTQRICNWAIQLQNGNENARLDDIDRSENHRSVLLAHVMHQTCLSLRRYLPFEKQLRLANLSLP